MADPKEPVFNPPKATPPEWTLDILKEHLQTAVLLELHTIPLYLFACYSLDNNPRSVYKFLTVVKQEMLHMSLSGNLLCAIGGKPKIYGAQYTPQYPCLIFYDKTRLELKPAIKENVEIFVRLEKPLDKSRAPELPHLLPKYDTIGQFYAMTMAGLKAMHEKLGDEMFKQDSIPRQFQTSDGSWYDGDMTAICDLKTAEDALTLVIEQGEGSTGNIPIMNTINTHYEIFQDLADNHPLDCHDVIENPITENLKSEKVYPVMKAFDAAYSYLLLTIERSWEYAGPHRQELVTNNIMGLMLTVLKPLALFLVQQPLQDGSDQNAAPAFNLHPFESTATAHTELKSWTDQALAAYPDVQELKPVKRAVDALFDLARIPTLN